MQIYPNAGPGFAHELHLSCPVASSADFVCANIWPLCLAFIALLACVTIIICFKLKSKSDQDLREVVAELEALGERIGAVAEHAQEKAADCAAGPVEG